MTHTHIGVAFCAALAEFLSSLDFEVVHVTSPKEARQVEGESFPWVVATSPNPALGPLISSLEARFGRVVYARLPDLAVEERNMPDVAEVTAPVPVGSILDLLGLEVPDGADDTMLAGDGSVSVVSDPGGSGAGSAESPVEAVEVEEVDGDSPVGETPWGEPPVVVSTSDTVDDDLVENGFDDDGDASDEPVDEPVDDAGVMLPSIDDEPVEAESAPSSAGPVDPGPSPFTAPPSAAPSPWSGAVPPASAAPPEPAPPAHAAPVPSPPPPAGSDAPPVPTSTPASVSEEVSGTGAGLPSQPKVSAPAPNTPAVPVDLWDSSTPAAASQMAARGSQRQCPVIVSAAGKGGVGKTLIASLLAARAAHADLNVVLIDANRGQGDVSSYLRLDLSLIPTVYDAAVSNDPARAIASPERVNAARNEHLDQIRFAVVAAPPPRFTDPQVVTSGVYSDVLRFARSRADLVVVDTQIMEDTDTSGLIDHFVTPTLVSGGWFLAASDMSRASVQNVQRRLLAFAGAGVPPDRMLLLFNRVETNEVDRDALGALFASTSRMLGIVPANPQIADAMNVGKLPHDHRDIAPLLDEALHRVTGLNVFVPDPESAGSSRGGFLSRLFGRKGGGR